MFKCSLATGKAGLLIGAGLIVSAQPAFAQDRAEPATPPESGDASQVIIVTAQKRAENIRDVPFSITALDDETLVSNRVQAIEDVARLVPGLEVGVGFGRQTSSITIRGIGPQLFNSATVVTFIDGFTTGLRTDVTSELFDLERVEVLKGPQATLYGRNAIGGTINYITRPPSDAPEMRFQAVVGNYGRYTGRASISGAIVPDLLSARLSLSATGRAGYFDNVLTGEENADGISDKSVRLALRLHPGGLFESNLSLSYTRTEDKCGDCVQSIRGYDFNNPRLLGQGAYDVNDLNRTINHEIPVRGFTRSVYTGVWNNMFDFGATSLTSITGYSRQHLFQDGDLNRLPGPIFFGIPIDSSAVTSSRSIFSEELRLASTGDRRFSWLIGAYYYSYWAREATDSITPFGVFPSAKSRTRTTNYAAFANGTYEIVEGLRLTLGLRYDYERTTQMDLLSPQPDGRVSSSELLPRISLAYKINDETNIYATVSRGYHSGGINFCFSDNAGGFICPPRTVGPEFVWNYEIGLRGGSGRQLSYGLAAYYIDWTDQQVTSNLGFVTFLVNAGTTRIYGLEGELHWNISPQFRIDLAANYNHARYRNFLDLSGVPTFYGVAPQRAGERPLLAPDFSATATAEYRQPIGGGRDVTARASARYTGRRAIDTSAVAIANSYTVADFSVSVGSPELRLTAFVTNAFDKTYATYLQLFGFPGIAPLIHAGDPRTFGLQIDASF